MSSCAHRLLGGPPGPTTHRQYNHDQVAQGRTRRAGRSTGLGGRRVVHRALVTRVEVEARGQRDQGLLLPFGDVQDPAGVHHAVAAVRTLGVQAVSVQLGGPQLGGPPPAVPEHLAPVVEATRQRRILRAGLYHEAGGHLPQDLLDTFSEGAFVFFDHHGSLRVNHSSYQDPGKTVVFVLKQSPG